MAERYVDIIHNGRVVGRRLEVDPSPPEPITMIPRDDFIERFTPQEWLAGQQAAQTDARLAMALALLMGKPDGMVNLASERVQQVLQYMVAINLLTAERARVIGTPVLP